MGSLLSDHYPKRDFFILDVADPAPKDDMALLEHPVFSLSVQSDMHELDYEYRGRKTVMVPSGKGLATITDKDIVLFCVSKPVSQMNRDAEVSRWVELSDTSAPSAGQSDRTLTNNGTGVPSEDSGKIFNAKPE